jgi:DNA-binding MarR family transcriptional regulator
MIANPTETPTKSPGTPANGETLVQLISRTYHALVPQFERHVGMSRARWALLALLQREGEISQAALQQQLSVDGAAITRQVKQLEEEGLVLRRAAPHDNRFTLVALTPDGQALVASMDDQRQSFEAIVGAGLEPDDVAALRRCLIRIRENMLAGHAVL